LEVPKAINVVLDKGKVRSLMVYSKRLEAGLLYHTKNKVQSLSPLRGEVYKRGFIFG
jgi:hypothetical protein